MDEILNQIKELARQLGFSDDEIDIWLNKRLPIFNNQTAMELINNGEGQVVLNVFDEVKAGFTL